MLKERILHDLKVIGIPITFELEIKNYSKQAYGRYYPAKKKVILYKYKDAKCLFVRSYGELLKTAIHEATHHYQWHHIVTFLRESGVMHDKNFVGLFNFWVKRAKHLKLIKDKEVINNARSVYRNRRAIQKLVGYTCS